MIAAPLAADSIGVGVYSGADGRCLHRYVFTVGG